MNFLMVPTRHPAPVTWIRPNPSISDQIRLTFLMACPPKRSRRMVQAVKKNDMKCHLFHFIALYYTFFPMPKVKPGKETVKFLAIFDHFSNHQLRITVYQSLITNLRMASGFRLITPLSGEGLTPKRRKSATHNA